jgi:hypothetical protein
MVGVDRMLEVGLSTSRKFDRGRVITLLMLLLMAVLLVLLLVLLVVLLTSLRFLGVFLSLSLDMALDSLGVGVGLILRVRKPLISGRMEHLVLGGRGGAVPEVVVVGLFGVTEVVQVGRHRLLLVWLLFPLLLWLLLLLKGKERSDQSKPHAPLLNTHPVLELCHDVRVAMMFTKRVVTLAPPLPPITPPHPTQGRRSVWQNNK